MKSESKAARISAGIAAAGVFGPKFLKEAALIVERKSPKTADFFRKIAELTNNKMDIYKEIGRSFKKSLELHING